MSPPAPEELDELTLARAQRGDEEACRALVVRYQRALFALLARMLGPRGAVEDLAQETFLRAFRALPGFDRSGPARLSTWLLTIGDFYRNYGYPYIDINNGGSLKGMLEGLDLTMKSADASTTIVPGHGTLIKRDAIVPYRDMILAVADKVQQMIAQGKSLQEVLAAKVTAPFDAKVAGGTDSSADRFVGAVYQELKGGK